MTGDDLTKFECLILTAEEETGLDQFLSSNDSAGLREIPERKILPLRACNVPRAKARSDILLFMERWRSSLTFLTESLDVLETASQEMRNSKCIRQFLSVVLRWGNFVNYGVLKDLQIKAITLSERQSACSAHLIFRSVISLYPLSAGSLLKLAEFKTNIDSKITSLHYIVANMVRFLACVIWSRIFPESDCCCA